MTLLDPILEPVINSPKLKLYVEQLQHALETEEEARNRFYNDITENDKAEFINGKTVFHSPVKLEHYDASFNLSKLLDAWVRRKKLGRVGYEKIMIELTRNAYEPDICFFGIEKSKKFKRKQMIFPTPDFVVEIISPSTEKNDRGIKFEDYALHGIEEYWIIDPDEESVEQYQLNTNDGDYRLKLKLNEGSISSFVILGFTIPVRAIFDNEKTEETLETFYSTKNK